MSSPFLSWLRKREYHRVGGFTLAAVFAAGAIYVAITRWIDLGYWSWDKLFGESSFPQLLAFVAVFLLTTRHPAARLVQPAITGLVTLGTLVTIPESQMPLVFLIVTVALLLRYEFFRSRALLKSLCMLAALGTASVAGELLMGRHVAVSFEVVVVFLCLGGFLYALFWEFIDPILWPERHRPQPAFFIASEHGLTRREFEVLEMVIQGQLDGKAVANHLQISPHTVDSHLKRVYARLGTGHSRAELTAFLSGRVIVWDHQQAEKLHSSHRRDRKLMTTK